MTKEITIPDIWDAFLTYAMDDKPLSLKLHNIEEANQLKSALSVHKTRILSADPSLKELLGDFILKFDTIPMEDKKVLLRIEMKKKELKKVAVEIVDEDQTDAKH